MLGRRAQLSLERVVYTAAQDRPPCREYVALEQHGIAQQIAESGTIEDVTPVFRRIAEQSKRRLAHLERRAIRRRRSNVSVRHVATRRREHRSRPPGRRASSSVSAGRDGPDPEPDDEISAEPGLRHIGPIVSRYLEDLAAEQTATGAMPPDLYCSVTRLLKPGVQLKLKIGAGSWTTRVWGYRPEPGPRGGDR